MTFLPANSLGPFLSTYQEFPIQDPEEMKRILTKMYTDLVNAINLRESGSYELVEQLNGERFYTGGTNQQKRFVYRKVLVVPAIAAGAPPVLIAHNITGLTFFTQMYGVVLTDAPDWRPLPFPSAVGNDITIRCTTTDLIVQNNGAGPNITGGFVVLEYIKT